MVWCATCERAWSVTDRASTSCAIFCPDPACGDGRPGAFLPYQKVRRLAALRWPRAPQHGERYPLLGHVDLRERPSSEPG